MIKIHKTEYRATTKEKLEFDVPQMVLPVSVEISSYWHEDQQRTAWDIKVALFDYRLSLNTLKVELLSRSEAIEYAQKVIADMLTDIGIALARIKEME